MNLLLLGGLSQHNKPWIYKVERALAPLFERALVHEYAHWSDPAKTMDIEAELTQITSKVINFGEYAVFAKSIGTVLTLKGIQTGQLAPNRCLFAGLPLGLVTQENLPVAQWVAAAHAPIFVIQNSHDPAGSFAEVQQLLAGAPAKLVELPGDSHNYENLSKLRELTAELLTI